MTFGAASRVGGLTVVAFALAGVAGGAAPRQDAPRPIAGGTYEASGVAAVEGTDGVLFVDDNRTREIFWMEIGSDGAQRAPAVAIPLPEAIEDPEGLAFDGTFFYVVGSQSKGNGPAGPGLARFAFDPQTRRVTGMESIARLKAWLVERVTAFEGMDGAAAGSDFDIEGLAWDPAGGRLLLGFRAPRAGGRALIVALKPRDARGPFTADALAIDGPPMQVALDGAGIRSLDYDPGRRAWLILSGPAGDDTFRLVEWRPDAAAPRTIATFPADLQPEGVTRVPAGLLVVFDTSRYTLIR